MIKIAVNDEKKLGYYCVDACALCKEDYIKYAKPGVAQAGTNVLNRNLTQYLTILFHTSLTADCTKLVIRDNTSIVQLRFAFGVNIWHILVTLNTSS